MSDPITGTPNYAIIAGQQVDINDPCAYARALMAVRATLITGGAVEETEIRSPLTTRRVKFSAGMKASDLDPVIADLVAACQARNGAALPRRTRFAIRGTFRPY